MINYFYDVGYFPSRSGGSIRGTSVFLGDYGLQVIEGGRISDTHLDVARSAVRRALKNEKGRYVFYGSPSYMEQLQFPTKQA